MVRKFSLAGLLRLRQVQEDQAASDLAAIEARVRDTSVSRSRVRRELEVASSEVNDVRTLHAMVAARASSRGMLADLDAVAELQKTQLGGAQSAFADARARSIALEKLETRHNEDVLADDSRAEQRVLDEIAGSAWARNMDRVIS